MTEKLIEYEKKKESIGDGQVEEENELNKFVLKVENVEEFLIKDFLTFLLNHQSPNLFKIFRINTMFLEMNLTEWNNNTFYQTGKNLINALHIVNNTLTAEKDVKLVEEFNENFTKNENEKQFLLQASKKKKTVI